MKKNYTNVAILMLFLVLAVICNCFAVNTKQIDDVRDKAVLSSEDFEAIDKFMAEAIDTLVKTTDFTSIANDRAVILARNKSGEGSAQAQYADKFYESAYKHISAALKQSKYLAPEDQRFKVVTNLLILIDELEDVRLAKLAVGYLKDKNEVVRYWAVRVVGNPRVVEQLNSGKADDLKLASDIAVQLKQLVEGTSPRLIALVARFAADIKVPEAEGLLLQIADMRIKKYADWAVDDERLDAAILTMLYTKISSAEVSNPAIARRFAQLYSYAIQRYVNGRDILNSGQKEQLASVLVETEKSCIGGLLAVPQMTIKKAVERDDYMGLLEEHSRLLGDKTRAGQLGIKLNFDYGKAADGSKLIAPLSLPAPPEIKEDN